MEILSIFDFTFQIGKNFNMKIILTESQLSSLRIRRRHGESFLEDVEGVLVDILDLYSDGAIKIKKEGNSNFIRRVINAAISEFVSGYVEFEEDDDEYINKLYEDYFVTLYPILLKKYEDEISRIYDRWV